MSENEKNFVILTVRMDSNVRKNIRVQAAKKDFSVAKYLEYLVNKDLEEDKRKEQ